ncbi:YtxH domain-containing protein [Thalassobacillus devorans]|uniref:YtxH domain-containing protein n=1 Tax=Thalassobacillus devorans TaxID=279813 RepID=UPI00048FB77C|nr:YtxH domain-containing protein [Thalassobacillus devorans]
MKEHKFWKGMIIGAVVGGAVTLLDKDTRNYVWNGTKQAGRSAKSYTSNPSEAIRQLRLQYNHLTNRVADGAKDVLEVLNKVEALLDKVSEWEKEIEKDVEKIADHRDVS